MAHDANSPRVIVKFKRRRSHGGHHGGAWKVAYADFVTAMMALFIVLWLLTQADMKLKQQIAMYFKNSGILSGGSALSDSTQPAKTEESRPLEAAITIIQGSGDDLEALRGHAREIEEAVARSPELAAIKDQVHVTVTPEGLEIQVVDSGATRRKDLLFDLNSAALKPALVQLLGEVAAHLGTLPNRVEIGGHTDARPFAASSGLTNWDLSFQRANNARKVLEERGLRAGQVLKVTAYADTKLLTPEDPLADENRRLSILARREEVGPDAPPSTAAATTPATDAAPAPPEGAHTPAAPEPAAATRGPGPIVSPPAFVTPGAPPA
jgi:chemotaxis protein MotB